MSDIRRRASRKGTTYQVRYPSRASKTGYAYKSFDTLKDARDFVESGKALASRGITNCSIKTVEQAIDKWLDICEKEGRADREPVSPGILEHYRWRARAMKAYEWRCELRDLQEPDIIEFRSWLKRTFTSDKAQKVLSSFHSVMIEMQKRGHILKDPAADVTIRTDFRYKEPVEIPTVQELQLILQTADRLANSSNNEIAAAWERYCPMIYLAADSGMRPQEYLALPPAALAERGVNVIQALDSSNRIGPPKTKAGRRYILVGAEALGMAKHYAKKHGNQAFVFPTRRDGGYQRYNNSTCGVAGTRSWRRLG